MNKAYNNKHDVFCSFSILLNVVNVEWVNEWMNISEKFASSLNVPKSDINITQMTYDGLP